LYTGAKVVATVTTDEELIAKLADSNVPIIKLGADIEVDGYLNVTRDVTIHGNNHKITRSVSEATDNESYVVMVSSGKLTARNLELESNNTQAEPIANAVGITVQTGASLDFDGGKI
ncbi:pectate lyase-like adhesive domain-containing protein, partial [Anaerobacillus sp. MEB173]|uniref:pectate lyase-like adhesive domain-containing protein n=1 Tax=Anaerobacillus sp. MEB173 TaxID=3383345 RepID=UPI003F93C101